MRHATSSSGVPMRRTFVVAAADVAADQVLAIHERIRLVRRGGSGAERRRRDGSGLLQQHLHLKKERRSKERGQMCTTTNRAQ